MGPRFPNPAPNPAPQAVQVLIRFPSAGRPGLQLPAARGGAGSGRRGGDPAPACPCRAGPGRAGAMPRPEVAGSYQEVGNGFGVLAAGGALPGVFAAGWGRWTGGRAAERSSPPG